MSQAGSNHQGWKQQRIISKWVVRNMHLVSFRLSSWWVTFFNGKINYKWPFSIAMSNYQRVYQLSYPINPPKNPSRLRLNLPLNLRDVEGASNMLCDAAKARWRNAQLNWFVGFNPPDKYELVSWDYYSQYLESQKNKCSKPPTSESCSKDLTLPFFASF